MKLLNNSCLNRNVMVLYFSNYLLSDGSERYGTK